MQNQMTYSASQLKKAMLFSLICGVLIGIFLNKISTQNKLIEQMVSKQVARDELNAKQDEMNKNAFKDVVVGDGRKY